jgi:hypothetical protein
METEHIENITDFLGKEDNRYFSNGYKYFDFKYENLYYQSKMLSGTVLCECNWDKKRNRHLHLGTVEYIALAATICEQMLKSEFYLSPEEIASSRISYFQMKIQSCIELFENTRIPISGELISIQRAENDVNHFNSCFEIRINRTVVKIEINHPVYFWFNISPHFDSCINESGLYCTGYKKRNHRIKNIVINKELMNCTALVSIEDHYSQKSGLGSRYCGTLLTDIILISGQLVQALFYTLEKTNRNQANNIWLKEFEVSINSPDSQMVYEAKLSFEDVKTLRKGNETWRSVRFKSELGEISSTIKMVSQII